MNNKLKNALAKANGLGEQRKIECINEGVRAEVTPEEAEGRGRKSIYLIFTFLADKFPEIKESAEYQEAIAWYEAVEKIKTEVKHDIDG